MSDSDLYPLKIAPGLYTEGSERSSVHRWVDGNRVRFFNGFPEKMGGWVKTLSLNTITGIVRNMISWSRLDNESLVALGANTGIWLLKADNSVTNITPFRIATVAMGGSDSALTNPFDTTDSSAEVVVNHTSHGAIQDDYVEFTNASATNGIPANELNATHQIIEVIDANSYKIVVTTSATTTGSGGGTVDYAYDITVGQVSTVTGKGWGLGRWNRDRDGWNEPLNFEISPGDAKVVIPARTWSLSPWGEDLICAPRNGNVFVYDSSAGGRATKIDEVPSPCENIIMSTANQQLFALGCVPPGGSVQDPMYIRWCDSRDYTVWTAAAANSAGGFRLDQGNYIISGLQIGRSILVFTDTSAYQIYPVSAPVYYGKQHLGKTSMVGPNAASEYQGVAYWMGVNNFYHFDGALGVLPCEVHSKVFRDLNITQLDKVVSGVNHRFNEISWFYPSKDATEIDRYVTYNTFEKVWSFGEMTRTAWRDNEYRFDKPYAIDSNGDLFLHEEGDTDDGQAMGEFLKSYSFDIRLGGQADTRNIIKIDTIVPDFPILEQAIQVTIGKRKWPQEARYEKGPYEIRSTTKMLNPKIRGRQIDIKLAGLGGGFWRFADLRIGGYYDGSR